MSESDQLGAHEGDGREVRAELAHELDEGRQLVGLGTVAGLHRVARQSLRIHVFM